MKKYSNPRDTIEVNGKVIISMEGESFSSKKAPITKGASLWGRPLLKVDIFSITVVFTKEKSSKTKHMEKAHTSIPFKTTNIREGGKTTSLTEGDVKNLETDHIIKENFKRV